MSKGEVDIAETIDRLEEIAETLEHGEVDLTTAKELREEADDHLEKLHDALDVGDGDLIEIDAENANIEASESAAQD